MLLNLLIYINKRKLNKMITSGYSYDEILKQSQKLDELINIYMRNWVRWKEWNFDNDFDNGFHRKVILFRQNRLKNKK